MCVSFYFGRHCFLVEQGRKEGKKIPLLRAFSFKKIGFNCFYFGFPAPIPPTRRNISLIFFFLCFFPPFQFGSIDFYFSIIFFRDKLSFEGKELWGCVMFAFIKWAALSKKTKKARKCVVAWKHFVLCFYFYFLGDIVFHILVFFFFSFSSCFFFCLSCLFLKRKTETFSEETHISFLCQKKKVGVFPR